MESEPSAHCTGFYHFTTYQVEVAKIRHLWMVEDWDVLFNCCPISTSFLALIFLPRYPCPRDAIPLGSPVNSSHLIFSCPAISCLPWWPQPADRLTSSSLHIPSINTMLTAFTQPTSSQPSLHNLNKLSPTQIQTPALIFFPTFSSKWAAPPPSLLLQLLTSDIISIPALFFPYTAWLDKCLLEMSFHRIVMGSKQGIFCTRKEEQSRRHKPCKNTLLQSSGTPELCEELSKNVKNTVRTSVPKSHFWQLLKYFDWNSFEHLTQY